VLAWLQDLALQEESEKDLEKENQILFYLIDFKSIIQET
jgi:hypothetical protein